MCWWARKQLYARDEVGALFHTVSKTFRYGRGCLKKVLENQLRNQ